jgi:dipeptidyl-peptidase-4
VALTYGAGYFTHGIARYSVTDWRFYDSIYTERYMDKPEENPAGYHFASVLTHAEKYKGNLLIIHGALDDNVHMQNSIGLIEELQRLGKHFEMMVYPNQRHGIKGAWHTHATRLDIDFWFRHFSIRLSNSRNKNPD